MSHATLAAFIRPEFPVDTKSDTSTGHLYSYRGPAATIEANIPDIGEEWADGLPVTSRRYVPNIGNSGVSDLEVDTTFQTNGGENISTTLESTRYQIRWVPQDLPLLQHKYFEEYLEDSVGFAELYGWEQEIDNTLKAANQYRTLDSSGRPTGTVQTVTTEWVTNYIALRKAGFDSCTIFSPVLTKVGTYRGTDAPGTGDCGAKEAPDWPGYPTDYEYIKSGDQAERLGTRPKWERSEEWTGFKKVFFDNTQLYVTPPGP